MADGIEDINKRFDKLLADLNDALADSDRLKDETDKSLEDLHRAVVALDEPEVTTRRKRRRVGA